MAAKGKISRGELAEEYFLEGYNCAQSVALAFADVVDLDKDTLLRAIAPFGGGMGRLREVCGAMSAVFAILGLLEGYSTPETGAPKLQLYAKVQELAAAFERENGTLICRDLMGLTEKHDSPEPEPRTAEYYERRPCPGLVASAANILQQYLETKDQQ